MPDPKYYTGSDEREFGSGRREQEPMCPHCEARDGEAHQEFCPLFAPECKCGNRAKRIVNGEWFCPTCAPKGRVKGEAA